MKTPELNSTELEQYSRHLTLSEIGPAGQKKLKSASVLIIGVGGLGCPALQYLCAAGVGRIGFIDTDVVSRSNLHRQILFTAEDIGQLKTEVALRKLSAQNSHISLEATNARLIPANASIVKNYDYVLDGCDNFPTRYLVNDACVQYGRPLISASIFKFSGQLAVLNYNGGPSYRCIFPEPPPPEVRPSCDEAGVLGVLPGILGTLQANEALKMILGIGQVLSGKLLLFDTLTLASKIVSFEANPAVITATRILSDAEYQSMGVCAAHRNDCAGEGEITYQEFDRLRRESPDSFQLIDVRMPFEKLESDLGGVLIPLNEIPASLERIDRERKVIIYCASGVRSLKACNFLRQQLGINQIYSLKGGIKAAA